MVSRILQQEAREVRFRSKNAIGNPGVEGRVAAVMRIYRVVTLIVDPRDRWNAHAHGPRQKRNKVRSDPQAIRINLHAAIGEAIDQRGGSAPGLLDLWRPFQALRRECVDIACGIVETDQSEFQVLASKPAWSVKADERALLQ